MLSAYLLQPSGLFVLTSLFFHIHSSSCLSSDHATTRISWVSQDTNRIAIKYQRVSLFECFKSLINEGWNTNGLKGQLFFACQSSQNYCPWMTQVHRHFSFSFLSCLWRIENVYQHEDNVDNGKHFKGLVKYFIGWDFT